jgi:hypothetical protein
LSFHDATIANVATPAIRTSLGASVAAAELIVGGYLIAYATLLITGARLLITGARLGQAYGYKRLFLLGMGAFAVTSLLAGLATDAAALVTARVQRRQLHRQSTRRGSRRRRHRQPLPLPRARRRPGPRHARRGRRRRGDGRGFSGRDARRPSTTRLRRSGIERAAATEPAAAASQPAPVETGAA